MIKRALLSIYLWFGKKKRQIIWYFEYRRIKSDITVTTSADTLPKGKYLVLIPHSDDEWIGCSSIIQDAEYEVVLCNMNMSGNDTAEIHAIRKEEMERIAKKFSRRLLTCNNQSHLVRIIATEEPSFIVVPYLVDWHDEHIEVMRFLYDSLLLLNGEFEVVMCQITVPISAHNITHANIMEKGRWKYKWSVFRDNYRTQKYFPWYRIACHERLNGHMVGSFAAEVFCVLSSNQWKEYFPKISSSVDERNIIRKRIVSLESARTIEQIKL